MGEPGAIALFVGPMFSGKTTAMVDRVRRAALAGTPCVLVKWAGDVRYEAGETVAAHSEVRQGSTAATAWQAPIRAVAARALGEVALDSAERAVGVDDGQFFADLPAQCEAWAREGRQVFVAALDGDFVQRPFEPVAVLVPRCEAVTKLSGVCMRCRRAASAFSQRIAGGAEVVQIGGRESYRAVCRGCLQP